MKKRDGGTEKKPVLFFAFANDKETEGRFLRELSKERLGILEKLEPVLEKKLCEVEVLPDATIDGILDVFQTYQDRIALFHYGGHADSYQLQLESYDGKSVPAYKEGLASFLAGQKGLSVIFLNGCSTGSHARALVQAGIPAVIATSRAIKDATATDLSLRFYNGIAGGYDLERAWKEATDQVVIQTGTGDADRSGLFWQARREYEDRFPWDIYYRPGAEEVRGWNLPEEAKNPLFGLPGIPEHYKLPKSPFLFLEHYRREHAGIFFGRSYYIRELYNRVSAPQSPPLILLYGQSGVGKSSLLDAGLLPRLEESHQTVYVSRDAHKGLLGTIKDTLAAYVPGNGGIRQPHDTNLRGQWKHIEEETGLPLVFILDQAEEMFTRPNDKLPDEFRDLLEALAILFNSPGTPPRGKLVLGYRKKYHPEIEQRTREHRLRRSRVFVEPLDREDIIDVVTGLTRKDETRTHFANMEVGPGVAGKIADDLLEDKNSPIAPVLQILMTKMWKTAKKKNPDHVHFTEDGYGQYKKQGIAMEDFFRRQRKILQEKNPGAVESGLALDVLKFHTTPLGTACTRTKEELHNTYAAGSPGAIDALLEDLNELSLLINPPQEHAQTGLAHDTLAPVVINEYNNSDAPGQRASRILANKIEDFKKAPGEVWLDEADLKSVEEGMKGMRTLDDDEKELLEISRARKEQREKEQERRRRIRIALIGMIVIAALIASLLWIQSEKNYKRADSLRLAAIAEKEVLTDPVIALHIAEKAWDKDKNKTVDKLRHKIYRENIFYKNITDAGSFDPRDAIYAVAFSPKGNHILAASEWDPAYLFNLEGNRLRTFNKRESEINGFLSVGRGKISFSPDGNQVLVGAMDGTARLWDLDGNPKGIFKAHNSSVRAVAFSRGGKYIVSGSTDNTACLIDLDTKQVLETLNGHNWGLMYVGFHPEDEFILTGANDGVRLWRFNSTNGTIEKKPDRFKHEGGMTSVALSPNGNYLLTGGIDGIARLRNLEKKGFLKKLVGHTGQIDSVTFSPKGKNILTASFDGTIRLWNLQGKQRKIFRGFGGWVISVAFSPDGESIITATDDGIIRLWEFPKDAIHDFNLEETVTSVGFYDAGKKVFLGVDKGAYLWEANGKHIRTIDLQASHSATAVSFSKDGRYMLAGLENGSILLLDLIKKDSRTLNGHKRRITSVSFSPDEHFVTSSSHDGTARLWTRAGAELQCFEKEGHAFYSAFASPRGQYILTAFTGGFRLWQEKDGGYRCVLTKTGGAYSIAFSPDFHMILSGDVDGSAQVCDLSGKEILNFKAHEGVIFTVAFSPDGECIFTGSNDGTACMWNLKGNLLQVFGNHYNPITSMAISPDNKYILLGSSSGTSEATFAGKWKVRMPFKEFMERKNFENFSDDELRKHGIDL